MISSKRSRLRALWLCGATALSSAAFAADLPADDAGARTIADFLAAYAGKAALPSVKISHDGSVYHVAFDLGAASAAMKSAGVTYDPALIQLKVFQQEDGAWRVEADEAPPISVHVAPPSDQPHAAKLDARVETVNLKSVARIDPRLNWLASVAGGADKVSLVERGPGIEELMELSGLKFVGATTSGDSGLVTTIHEPLQSLNFTMDIDPKGVDPASHGPSRPVHVSAKGEDGKFDAALTDFQPQPFLDAWRFAAAHPERADIARDFDKLKPILTALVANHFKIDEQGVLDKLDVMSEAGPISVKGLGFGIGAANRGAATGFYERFSVRAIKLPEGLAPPMYDPFVPVSFHFGFKATGFDIEAAAQEWLADAKLDGDRPILSDSDRARLTSKLVGGRPIVVEIEPSRLVAPSLDLSFEGELTIDDSERSGTIKLTLRDFATTEAALEALPPKMAQQITPAVIMVKGLATTEPDGSLVWVCTLGHDKIFKVNGLAVGKAPF